MFCIVVDTSGKVRVWSWDNPEHMTKLETAVFSGDVKDLDWDSESKKIIAVGDGAASVNFMAIHIHLFTIYSVTKTSLFLFFRWQRFLPGTREIVLVS